MLQVKLGLADLHLDVHQTGQDFGLERTDLSLVGKELNALWTAQGRFDHCNNLICVDRLTDPGKPRGLWRQQPARGRRSDEHFRTRRRQDLPGHNQPLHQVMLSHRLCDQADLPLLLLEERNSPLRLVFAFGFSGLKCGCLVPIDLYRDEKCLLGLVTLEGERQFALARLGEGHGRPIDAGTTRSELLRGVRLARRAGGHDPESTRADRCAIGHHGEVDV